MIVEGKALRTLWVEGETVRYIDQTLLPHQLKVRQMRGLDDACEAIAQMHVRGAPLIGVTAAFGLALALRDGLTIEEAGERLVQTRPTAVNLRAAVERVKREVTGDAHPKQTAWALALRMAEEDVASCRKLGEHGLPLLKSGTRVLTHCNAGWLATIDWGTALAPIYLANERGIGVHVWVDETRPRNQGAALTAWELLAAGIPCTVIADNAGGHLMQQNLVDVVIVGTDRVAKNGDVCNKIGTYLKALAAQDSQVPFYVAVPTTSIDWRISTGADVVIEERSADEVHYAYGRNDEGLASRVRLTPEGASAKNPGFDVTPARLITGLITERGICKPSELAQLFGK